MKLSYVIGSFVLLVVCVGWRLGIGREIAQINLEPAADAVSQRHVERGSSSVDAAPVDAAPVDSETVQSTVQSSAPIAPAVEEDNSTNVAEAAISEAAFEELSHCEQMDALDRGGKSISEFVLDSGRFSQYDNVQQSECPWHKSQLDLAYQVLYPPTIATAEYEDYGEYDEEFDEYAAADEYGNAGEEQGWVGPNTRSIAPRPPYRLSRRQWLRQQQRRIDRQRQPGWNASARSYPQP